MTIEDFVFCADCAKGFIARAAEIMLLESEGNYVKVTLSDGRSVAIRQSLRAILKLLDPKVFFQANRTAIVNLDHVASAWPDGKIVLFAMNNGQEINLSRENSIELRKRFSLR